MNSSRTLPRNHRRKAKIGKEKKRNTPVTSQPFGEPSLQFSFKPAFVLPFPIFEGAILGTPEISKCLESRRMKREDDIVSKSNSTIWYFRPIIVGPENPYRLRQTPVQTKLFGKI